MIHSFCVDFALKYSIEAAIIIDQLYWWLHKNACEQEYIKEDRVWCYFSARGLAKYIPYMNSQKLRRELRKLEDAEIIKSGNFNKAPTNQTLWYTFTDSFLLILNDANYDVSHFSKMNNGMFKNEQCNKTIINNNLIEDNINEDKKESNDSKKEDDLFNIFWSKYHKGGKKAAFDKWSKLKEKEKEKAINTVDDYLTYCRRSKRPLKDCSAYLFQKCFNDDWTMVPDCYVVRETDDERRAKFKKWICENHADLIYHRNPLTFEQADEIIEMHTFPVMEAAMKKLESIDIHQYFNIKSGIEKIIENDDYDEYL